MTRRLHRRCHREARGGTKSAVKIFGFCFNTDLVGNHTSKKKYGYSRLSMGRGRRRSSSHHGRGDLGK